MKTKKTISILFTALFIFTAMLTPVAAYEKPEVQIRKSYPDDDVYGENQYFDDSKSQTACVIADIVSGEEGSWSTEMGRRKAEEFAKYGLDASSTADRDNEEEMNLRYQAVKDYCDKYYGGIYIASDIIQTFKISKEQFIEANRQVEESEYIKKYTDEEIDLLYSGNMNAILNYFKYSLAYVYEDEIYCLAEVLSLDYSRQYEMYKNGDFGEYLHRIKSTLEGYNEDNYAESMFYPMDKPQNCLDWTNYILEQLETGVKPSGAPPTGDGAFALFAAALASAGAAMLVRRRRRARARHEYD